MMKKFCLNQFTFVVSHASSLVIFYSSQSPLNAGAGRSNRSRLDTGSSNDWETEEVKLDMSAENLDAECEEEAHFYDREDHELREKEGLRVREIREEGETAASYIRRKNRERRRERNRTIGAPDDIAR